MKKQKIHYKVYLKKQVIEAIIDNLNEPVSKEDKEKAAKKAAAETCFVEFAGKQISVDEVTENAKKHWKASNNGTI